MDATPLIIIVSNRGPFSFRFERGEFKTKRGAGGLVTALTALAQKHDVLWVAAALGKGDLDWVRETGGQAVVEDITLKLVPVQRKRYEQYYGVIANPLLWFIQHQLWDLPQSPSITTEVWDAWRRGYTYVNRLFAEQIAESIKDVTDRPIIVFPQDYHLYLLPKFLRELVGDRVYIQPFIHIPWPGTDVWRVLPTAMRNDILESLIASNRVGFQTAKDAFNFIESCRFFLADAHAYGSRTSVEYRGKRVEARAYPISIDAEQIESLSDEAQTTLHKHQILNFLADNKLILRVDRIEPSKNILRGLEAFRQLLIEHPEHRGRVMMVALLVPSRLEVEHYQLYFQQVMGLEGSINAQFSTDVWEPVRIIVGENYMRALAAMQLFDVLLVNPLADGMNLVAKEGMLVNRRDGVLILSEHAGAFFELGEHALVVSPFDVHGTTEAMHQALTMPQDERQTRAEALRAIVKNASVEQWFDHQLEDALQALSSQSRSASTPSTP